MHKYVTFTSEGNMFQKRRLVSSAENISCVCTHLTCIGILTRFFWWVPQTEGAIPSPLLEQVPQTVCSALEDLGNYHISSLLRFSCLHRNNVSHTLFFEVRKMAWWRHKCFLRFWRILGIIWNTSWGASSFPLSLSVYIRKNLVSYNIHYR